MSGPVLQEIVYDGFPNYPTFQQKLRLVNGSAFIDLEHTLDTLPLNREIISRFDTNIATQGTLFTDDTGFEIFPRMRNDTLPISGNYHSLVQTSYIRDQKTSPAPQLSVMTSHTMGVASLSDGQLEYMMYRRLNSSDDQG